MDSLIENVKELKADITVVTETWMRDEDTREAAQDLSLGAGLGLLVKNRPTRENGTTYGGVAVIWKESSGMFKEAVLRNPESYEVLVAAGSVKGRTRKLLVVACYIPPNYSKQRGSGVLEYIENVIIELKRRYNDPYLFVACLLYTSPSPRDRQKSRMPSSA